jgi:hypothetical protein
MPGKKKGRLVRNEIRTPAQAKAWTGHRADGDDHLRLLRRLGLIGRRRGDRFLDDAIVATEKNCGSVLTTANFLFDRQLIGDCAVIVIGNLKERLTLR